MSGIRDPYDVEEVIDRLNMSVERLQDKHDDPATGMTEKTRLGGKIEGVKLALSYVRESRQR